MSTKKPQYITILTTENIVEGIFASIFIVLSYYILRNYFKFSKPTSTMLGWFFTWFMRKLSVNLYRHYKTLNTFNKNFPIHELKVPVF